MANFVECAERVFWRTKYSSAWTGF